ncbi:MAG: ribosome-binding factor A [Candidatus Giovannonibacteria bacterium]|nr:MAG: ribosome-binding factor A [Candidatus Giovannonibacteria bacterium]
MMAHQAERFSSFLKRELNGFLQRNAPHDEGVFISVAKIHAPERSDKAEITLSVFPEKAAKGTIKSVKKMAGEARKYLASRSRRRFIPKIIFLVEEDAEKTTRLEKLLDGMKSKSN